MIVASAKPVPVPLLVLAVVAAGFVVYCWVDLARSDSDALVFGSAGTVVALGHDDGIRAVGTELVDPSLPPPDRSQATGVGLGMRARLRAPN